VDDRSVLDVSITRFDRAHATDDEDVVAVEEPLEIQLGRSEDWTSVSVTMRTPGHDQELALGFLFSEGILRSRDDAAEIRPHGPFAGAVHVRNIVRVHLAPDVRPDLDRLRRNFYTTSSCGVCGKASLEALRTVASRAVRQDGPVLAPEVIHALPGRLRDAQQVFNATGGLHAAGLFDSAGHLIALREDVGRHNAVDKLIGHALLDGLDTSAAILVVSGRASFELVQKAVMAGLPVMIAVGAPSSLAVQLAREFGITLAGFARDRRFNVYSGEWRISRHEASHERKLDPASPDPAGSRAPA